MSSQSTANHYADQVPVNLTHKITLDPTCKQRSYFARAAGTARFVFNWGLAEWNQQYTAGKKPSGNGKSKSKPKSRPWRRMTNPRRQSSRARPPSWSPRP